MAGVLLDCNYLFAKSCHRSKEELRTWTIFHLVPAEKLGQLYDLLRQMIAVPQSESALYSVIVPTSLNFQLGLNVRVAKDDEGDANCFCVMMVKNRGSYDRFDESEPVVPVTSQDIDEFR
jgi:hypothetical protein